MTTFTKTFNLGDTEFEVEFEASPYVAAKTYGPPENCHPAEGGEVEIESILVGGFEMLEFLNETTLSKLGQMASESAPDCFSDAADQAGEDKAESQYFD